MASSKRIQFFKGTKDIYNTLTTEGNPKKSLIENGIYFCTDRKTIMAQGFEFGGFDTTIFNGVVMNLKVENGVLTYDTVVAGQTTHQQTNLTLVTNNDHSINVEPITNGGVNVSVKVKPVNAGEDGLKLGDNGLYVDLTNTDKKIADERTARQAAIQGMSLASTGGTGKYITTIAQTNGKVTATAVDLTATAVTYDKNGDKIIAKATNVSAAIKELDAKVAANKDAELTYKTVKLTAEEVTALGDVNVKEAYKVVSVNKEGTKTTVGDIIKIYKDSSLVSIDYTETGDKNKKGQFLKYVYTLADGTEKTVYVDMSKLVDQAEVENGIQAIDGKLSIKVAEGNETKFLTVDANGLKLSGVEAAIATAKNDVIDGASAGYNTLKGLEDKLKDEARKIVVLNGNVNTEGSVAKTVNDAKVTLQNSINTVQQKVDKNVTDIQSLNTQVKKANAIEVKGISDITVTPSTGGSDNHQIFTVSGASLVTKTEYDKLNIQAGNGIGVSGDKTQGYTISNTASKTDSKVANQYVTSVSQSNGVITVERAQPDAKEIKYTKAEATSSITSTTVQGALEEIDHDLQWIDAGTF